MPGNGHINALVFSEHILTYARVICVTHTLLGACTRPVPQNLPDGNSRSAVCPCCRAVRVECVSGRCGLGASHIPHTSPCDDCAHALKVPELKCFGAFSHPRPSMDGIVTGVSSPYLCQQVSKQTLFDPIFNFSNHSSAVVCGSMFGNFHDFLQLWCPWTSAVNVVKIRL